MTDPNGQKDDPANPASEPVVSKPYIMPDDPEEGSVGGAGQGSRGIARQDAADAGGNGKPAQADRERGGRCANLWHHRFRPRRSRYRGQSAARARCGSGRDQGNRPIPVLKALIEGVELTERSLLNTLEKNGVKKFDPSGEKFDPNFQQAMYEVPDPSVPAGTVVQVVQAGYMIGERVLRPALVAVSKGGAKVSAAEQT